MRKNQNGRVAFTLIELLVVVAIIALLLSILLPAFGRAREQSKGIKCLTNLKALGQGVIAYAGEEKRLPGPVHPALYRNQGIDALTNHPEYPMSYNEALFHQQRFLTYKLKETFNDRTSWEDSVTDQVSTCPKMLSVMPDEAFYAYENRVYPTHYAINNVGENGEGGAVGNVRTTDPAYYFGFSSYSASDPSLAALERQNPPQPISRVKKPAEEWMIADAWYRSRTNPAFPALQQEGPYQWEWTGNSLPCFAPHYTRLEYRYEGASNRRTFATQIRNSRADGKTNTVYFDGHAAPVPSRSFTLGTTSLLYGFRGTVNSEQDMPQGYWQ